MKFSVIGPDDDALTPFFADLNGALGEQVMLVEKRYDAAEARYTVHCLRRDDGDDARYGIENSADETRPPSGATWFAPLEPVHTYAKIVNATATPRVFRHQSGSLTCRCDNIKTAAVILSALSKQGTAWHEPNSRSFHSTPTPAYRHTIAYDHDAFCRVLTKISLNVIAKTSELDVIRKRYFDRARAYALCGKPHLPVRPGRNEQIPDALEPLAQDRHLIGIEVERRCGMEIVRAVFRLYGGPVQQARLAVACGSIVGVMPVWLSIDYVSHRVEVEKH